MCGIVGVASRVSDPGLRKIAERMNGTIVHRGPDEGGVSASADGHVALGSRRLAIIDLSHGQQPMHDASGRYTVVTNGEIYNHEELRARWRSYDFRTRSDTEVLLAARAVEGVDVASQLRGMFAFALWDRDERQLILGRDRFGKKPLFYCERDGRLYFASELKALIEVLPALPPDRVALAEYLTLGYIPGRRTAYRGISRLPAGHELIWSPDKPIELRRYWSPPLPIDRPTPERSDDEWEERIHAVLKEAVRLRLLSDVPLGAFLSGGIDSSTIVAFCRQFATGPFHTFSVRAQDGDPADAQAAQLVSQVLGTTHHELLLQCPSPDAFVELLRHFDEPFGDSSLIPTAAVSALAREHVTVSLSGDGGDELFGGYDMHRMLAWSEGISRLPLVRPVSARLAPYWPPRLFGADAVAILGATGEDRYLTLSAHPMMYALAERSGLCSREELDEAFSEVRRIFAPPPNWREIGPIARGQWIDYAQAYLGGDILPKVDIASMRHSLEVRCPLLDQVLAQEVASLPASLRASSKRGKLLLRRIALRYVPASVIERPKKGFSVPLKTWLSGPLRPVVEDLLGAPSGPASSLLDVRALRPFAAHPRRDMEASAQYRLLSLAVWVAGQGKRSAHPVAA